MLCSGSCATGSLQSSPPAVKCAIKGTVKGSHRMRALKTLNVHVRVPPEASYQEQPRSCLFSLLGPSAGPNMQHTPSVRNFQHRFRF